MSQYKDKRNLGASFKDLVGKLFYHYRGYPIWIRGTGYEINGQYFATREEARAEVDRMYDALDKSIIGNHDRRRIDDATSGKH